MMKIKNIILFIKRQSTFATLTSSKRIALGFFLLLFSHISFSQVKEDNIGTEVVNVVKPYTPTISDAFKVKEVPVITNEESTKKENVKYTIFPFPVASTFSPSKGNAQGLEKPKQERLFKNYATLGVGNFGALNAELYVTDDLSNSDYFGGMFRHQSSQDGIKNIPLANSFYDTSVDLVYGSHQQEVSWNISGGFKNQIYNWYGLPATFGSTLTVPQTIVLINSINPQQSYTTISAAGSIAIEDGILSATTLNFNHFSDTYDSTEDRFVAKPTFKFDVMDEAIDTKITVDYVGGSFKNNYEGTNKEALKYGFTNLGIVPSFVMKKEDWTINIGAGFVYSMGAENKSNKFYIYPSATASLKVVGDLMIFYSGAVGDLQQNSYQNFVDVNPFLSPTLTIRPTNEMYNLFGGLRGKLASTISYDVRGSYAYDENKALYVSNNYSEKKATHANYAFGNSMQIVYDDMKVVRFYGEIKADLTKSVTVEVDGTFSSYNNKMQKEAWNLPSIQFNSTIDFAVTEKWFAGLNLFYVGERKDQQLNTDILYAIPPKPITLDSYFDLNANVRFKYSERFTTYLKANNITNNVYSKWMNYPVQGFQVLLGANYKFDF